MHRSSRLATLPSCVLACLLALAIPAAAQDAAALESGLKADPLKGLLDLLAAAEKRWIDVKTYKARFVKLERGRDEETISYKFIRDHGIFMEWLDDNNPDKKALFIRGKYKDMLNVQVKVMFVKARVEKSPTDPDVLAKTNHPITESGFGNSLEKMRKLTQELAGKKQVQVKFDGMVPGPDGQKCFKITRTFTGGTALTKSITFFDAATFMPVEIDAYDKQGALEKYTYKKVVLNPKLSNGEDELKATDFYRSRIFKEDGDWGPEKENWQFKDIAPKWIAARGGKEN